MAQDQTATPSSQAAAQTAPPPPVSQPIQVPEPSGGPLQIQAATPPPAASPIPAPAAAPSPEPEHPGVREFLKSLGMSQFERHPDDATALQEVAYRLREAERLQDLARIGQQVYPHLSEYQKWLAEQDKARKVAEAAAAKWWNPPEYDPRWAQQIVRDPQTGELKAAPGAPLNVVDKYRAALEHSQGFLEKFAFDPIGAIRPGIEEVAKALVNQTVQEQMQVMQERLAARDMLQQNSPWMFQQDQAGQSVMTPYGQVYAQAVSALDQRGIRDIGMQNEWARDKATIAMLADQLKQIQAQLAAQVVPAAPQLVPQPPAPALTPVEAQQQANEAFTRRRGTRKPSQSNPATTTDTPILPGTSSLRQAILAELEKNGLDGNSKLVAM